MERQLEVLAGASVSIEQLEDLKAGFEAKFQQQRRGLTEVIHMK